MNRIVLAGNERYGDALQSLLKKNGYTANVRSQEAIQAEQLAASDAIVLDASESCLDFKATLQRVARSLRLVASAHAVLPAALQAEANTFVKQFAALLRMTDTSAAREQPAAAVEAIDLFQDVAYNVLRRQNTAWQHMA